MTARDVAKRDSERRAKLAEAIRSAKERLRLTNTDLAYAYSTLYRHKHRQTVENWLNGGHFPPFAEFPDLCELLGVSANELVQSRTLQGKELESHREQIMAAAQLARTREKQETERETSPPRGPPPKRRRPSAPW